MALIADIEKTQLFTEVKDVYLRINSIRIYPMYNMIKISVAGYPITASREKIRLIEEQQETLLREKVFIEPNDEIVGGSALLDVLDERDGYNEPPYDAQYPVHIWYDTYTIDIKPDMDLNDKAGLYERLYSLIKKDDRLSNLRDDLEEDTTEE